MSVQDGGRWRGEDTCYDIERHNASQSYGAASVELRMKEEEEEDREESVSTEITPIEKNVSIRLVLVQDKIEKQYDKLVLHVSICHKLAALLRKQ